MRFQYENRRSDDSPIQYRSGELGPGRLERHKNVKAVKKVETNLKIAKRDFFLWDGYLKQFL